jgi:putative ABC transport system ATP-binding protein
VARDELDPPDAAAAGPTCEPLLRLDGVGKVYVSEDMETHALRKVYLTIGRGEFVAISGPSGSGKTTLLSLLGLLDRPSTGTMHFGEHDVSALDAAARAGLRNRDIGFIFQGFNLIADLTVQENVELPLVYRGTPARRRRARVLEVLDRLELADRRGYLPSQLSGGQQQRVAVARAIAGEPRLLLADEPTGNLDSTNAEGVLELLRELHRGGSTVCIVTHDPRHTRWAERVVRLFDGRVVGEDATWAA